MKNSFSLLDFRRIRGDVNRRSRIKSLDAVDQTFDPGPVRLLLSHRLADERDETREDRDANRRFQLEVRRTQFDGQSIGRGVFLRPVNHPSEELVDFLLVQIVQRVSRRDAKCFRWRDAASSSIENVFRPSFRRVGRKENFRCEMNSLVDRRRRTSIGGRTPSSSTHPNPNPNRIDAKSNRTANFFRNQNENFRRETISKRRIVSSDRRI